MTSAREGMGENNGAGTPVSNSGRLRRMAPPSLGIPDVNFKGSKTRVCDFDHAYTDNTRPLVEAANAGVPHQDMELSTSSRRLRVDETDVGMDGEITLGASLEQFLSESSGMTPHFSEDQGSRGDVYTDARRERATVDLTEEEATKAAVKEALRVAAAAAAVASEEKTASPSTTGSQAPTEVLSENLLEPALQPNPSSVDLVQTQRSTLNQQLVSQDDGAVALDTDPGTLVQPEREERATQ
mmetsp:Transcript_70845/g.198541  ORF Transcript_70845/g.198541 Transcript_70845/m.198541 type:complete len:241 (+) Transcript_70845:390-1112(+)